MHPSCFRLFRTLCAIIVGLSLGLGSGHAEEKKIRLLNELITTQPPAVQTLPQLQAAASPAVDGLFLIQFRDHFNASWAEQLKKLNVELVRYVPDDAFIARLRGAQIETLKRQPFVQYVGPYRAEHKVHPAVRRQAQAGAIVKIRALLPGSAMPDELATARGGFTSIERDSATSIGHIMQGTVSAQQLNQLAGSSSVLWIERAAKPKLFDEIAAKIVGGDDGDFGTDTITQQLGYDGRGVAVAVADSGIDSGDIDNMHPDLAGRVDSLFYYGDLTDASDEHSHGTHVSGIIAGNAATGEIDELGYRYGLGVASGAHLVGQRIFDGAGNYILIDNDYKRLTRDAVRAGAKIGSNSWGDDTQGEYDLSAAEFDGLVRDADDLTPGDQPYILEFSAGNAGPYEQTIGSPAVAKNVIATGASENNRLDFFLYTEGQEAMADFSSRGPCRDGRIKPDVVAPGTWIASARSVFANDDNAWAPISGYYMYQGGTSQAGPQVSGAAAVFVQYYREVVTNTTPSPALVKAALINSAVDMDAELGTSATPNNDEGWGRVDLTEIIDSNRRFEFLDQSVLLTNGQVFEKHIIVASTNEPFKITLAYTDVPGFPGAIPALVNNLDLEVIAPDGSIYRGNQFNEGESVPNAPSGDTLNNVEGVFLRLPLPGDYIVRVRARNVAQDARKDTGAVDQDFALVASADIPFPGAGVLFFDRRAYRVPDNIRITLIDPDLAGQATVSIVLRSTTEPSGETIILKASGATGTFTSIVATATSVAVPDGKLQIQNGDDIQAEYFDASPAGLRIATARADLVPPVAFSISATNQFGRTLVRYQTDEPAGAVIYFGINNQFNLSVTNALLLTTHQIALDGLTAGVTYQYYVVSKDEAGNTSTNNNGGSYFTFVPASAASILLVDSYITTEGFDDVIIPRTNYTDPLDETGIGYEVWDVESMGLPTAGDLHPFRIVIWRINDSLWGLLNATNYISTTSQSAITDYLNTGGSFFMASMETLSRLGTVPFRTNVLKVVSFDEDVGVEAVVGVDNDPVANGMDLLLDYSLYPNPLDPESPGDYSDTLSVIGADAAPVFLDAISNKVAGVRYPKVGQDSISRVVFLPFPFDAVPTADNAPNNRASLLRNIISFLAPGLNGLGTIALDNSQYTIPSQVTVEVGDSDLAGQGQTTVHFSSDTDPVGTTITLTATTRPGLFRGYLTLVASTNSAAPGKLRTKEGDTILAQYFDASANSYATASAIIDTVGPVISGVSATPDFGDTLVEWSTSEEADSQVQYGESRFLGRTAVDAKLTESHQIVLPGLLPDRTYYYQVVSRDLAGNSAVDDNNGQLYTFHTLLPRTPPFFDNMDNSGTNWTVLTGDGSQASWELGVPDNGYESSAASPPNAWGSNLHGNQIDQAQTFLISPAFDLNGGNISTLTFDHSFFSPEFDDNVIENAQLYISTNGGSAWILLADYSEETGGWITEEVSLTPYVGKIIRLGWYYEQFSIEANPRPGWLVDNVALTLTSAAVGTLQISNNVSQATYVVSGPLNFSGSGLVTNVIPAPAGQYTITYGAVPFYTSPMAQSLNLAPSGQIVFTGNYTLNDSNGNGIADEWEQAYFGSIAPSHPPGTDTDHDGMSDFAEFMAGTNPTNSLSKLTLSSLVPGPGGLSLTWPASAGRSYRVLGSSNLVNWATSIDWMRATGQTANASLGPTNGPLKFFRLEVRP